MNKIDELTELFKEFPGIGPRQAKRFVYHLLRKNDHYVNQLVQLIPELRKNTKTCIKCYRYFSSHSSECDICSNRNRNSSILMIVARDNDLENIEKTDSFDGNYFVLGGVLPVLDTDSAKFIRLDELKKLLSNSPEISEIVLAFPVNPEGDNTAEFLKKHIGNIFPNIKITLMGRGLSTGLELEYSDKETIKNALENRH